MNPGSFCGSCGAVVKPGALYCGSCGSPAAPASIAAPAPAAPTMIGTVGRAPVPAPPRPVGAPPSGPPGFAGYATFGRRVGAYVIDAIPSLIIAGFGYALLFSALVGRSVGGANLALILLLVGPLAYFVVLWAMAAKGSSPGNAILGIRVVREAGGGEPGAGLGLGRLLLKGLLIGITFYIGGFSPLWDKTGRRKGWWDSACSTVVLDRDAVPAYRAATDTPPGTMSPPDPYPVPEASLASAGAPAAWPPSAPEPQRYADAGAGHPSVRGLVGTSPAGSGKPVAAGPPGVINDRPDWDIAPVQAPDPVAARPAAPAAVTTWGDRPVNPSMTSFGSPAGPPPPPPPPVSVARRAAPPIAEPGHPSASSWAAPAESSVISSVPGFGAPRVMPADESPDHTRLRVAPQPSEGSGWFAELDDGRRLPVAGGLILGRDPSALPTDGTAVSVAVTDEARSVSKTHLLLELGPAGVQVTDRHSTNGVVVMTAGVELPCVPGVATPVPDGSTVRFGDRSLRVRQG